MCFTFWFAAFGAGDTTSLKIYKYEGKAVDRMDADYDDFTRQDISEGKDEDDDSEIPSVGAPPPPSSPCLPSCGS
jgi:hypothetical protein